jgi:hypothetical protein
MRVIAILLLLGSYVTLMHARQADARPESIRPGVSYYSDEFVAVGLVHDIVAEKNYEEVFQLYSYYEAIYDERERVVVFKEYKRGQLIRTEEYRYRSSGDLLERRTLRPGKPAEITPAPAPAGRSE